MRNRHAGDIGDVAKRCERCGRLVREDRATSHGMRAGRDAGSAPAESAVPSPSGPSPMRAGELEADPVVDAYKRHIDRTLLRQNLRRSATERVANLSALQRLATEARRAGRSREHSP